MVLIILPAAAAAAAKSLQSCLTLCDPMDWDIFPGKYWSGLPSPSPGDLPNPGIEPRSPALQVDSLPLSYLESPLTEVKAPIKGR